MSGKERLIRESVDGIVDGVGKLIDDGIKESVVGLLLNEFPTTQSCEGHLKDALPFPWVEVHVPYPKEPNPTNQALLYCKTRNVELQQRMRLLLDGFYNTHESIYRLGISEIGIWGAFRVQPSKDESQIKPDELSRYQSEMVEFTDYLLVQGRKDNPTQ